MGKIKKKNTRLAGIDIFVGFVVGLIPLGLESYIVYNNIGQVELINLVILCSEMFFFYCGFASCLLGASKACKGNYSGFENSLYSAVAFIIAAYVLRILRDYRMLNLVVPIQPTLILGYPFISLTYAYKRRNDKDWKIPCFWMLTAGIVALVFWIWMVSDRGWTGSIGMGNFLQINNGTLFIFIINYFCVAMSVLLRKKFVAHKVSKTILILSIVTSLAAISYSMIYNGITEPTRIYLFWCAYLPFYSIGNVFMLSSIAIHYQYSTYFNNEQYF